MILGLRRKAGEFILRRNLKQNKRGIRAVSLDHVQSVLLLVNMDNEERFAASLKYERFLRKEEGVRLVNTIAYTDKKELPGNLIAEEHQYFLTRKDLNWFYSPINKEIVKLLKSKHQLLVDTSFDEVFPLNFALAVSNASFKVGIEKDYHKQYLDFMIHLKEEEGIHDLFSQLNHYLNMFKN